MRLIYVKGRNFKGLADFTLNAEGKNVTVFGANGAGKTTIADMVSWLLFDKDSLGQSNFEIKPKDGHALEVEVEGRFENDGFVTLRKVFKEKWTKKRGSIETEFSGHETSYFIDDVPVKMGEYKAKVAEIATKEDIFRLLTSPTYFNEVMHWQKRRELLFDICGNVTDEQIIASNQDLADLPAILAGKPADDYKKIVMGRRKKINEEIEGIPARIDEQTRSKPELDITNSRVIIDKLTRLRMDLDAKNQQIARAQAGGGVAELQTKIVVIDGEIQTIINEHKNGLAAKVQGFKDDLSLNRDRLAELRRELQSATSQKGIAEAELANQAEVKASLLADYRRILAETFSGDTCPTCSQQLPSEQIDEAAAKFNTARAKALESNISKGKACATHISGLTAKIESLSLSIIDIERSMEGAEAVNADLAIKITNIEKDAPAVGNLPAMVDTLKRRDEIVKQIESIQSRSTTATDKLTAEKQAIEADIAEQEKHLAKIEQAQAADLRIAELKAEEKALAGEFAKLEKHLFLIESFVRAKVAKLEESINSKFRIVKFRLFKDQINGGIEEVCEAMIDGVPYYSANHASRIQAGLDICQAVGEYYNFFPVIFVDGRESVTELPEMTAQVISLVVSPDDKALRVQ